jgi:hypothetical protein
VTLLHQVHTISTVTISITFGNSGVSTVSTASTASTLLLLLMVELALTLRIRQTLEQFVIILALADGERGKSEKDGCHQHSQGQN